MPSETTTLLTARDVPVASVAAETAIDAFAIVPAERTLLSSPYSTHVVDPVVLRQLTDLPRAEAVELTATLTPETSIEE